MRLIRNHFILDLIETWGFHHVIKDCSLILNFTYRQYVGLISEQIKDIKGMDDNDSDSDDNNKDDEDNKENNDSKGISALGL